MAITLKAVNAAGDQMTGTLQAPSILVGAAGSTGAPVFHAGTASEMIPYMYGNGGKQGNSLDAHNFTEDGSKDLNKLLTTGIYTLTGTWKNGPNNNEATDQSLTSTVQVLARNYPSGAVVTQILYLPQSAGAGTPETCYPRQFIRQFNNTIWTFWRETGGYASELEYRLSINRPGDNSNSPYITLTKEQRPTATPTASIGIGSINFRLGPRTSITDVSTGVLLADIISYSEKSGDIEGGRLALRTRTWDTTTANTTTIQSQIQMYKDRIRFYGEAGNNYAEYAAGVLTVPTNVKIAGKDVHHSGFFACIISPSQGTTGCPNEITDAALPLSVAKNSRYILTNPFGVNTPVHCVAQIFVNDRWSDSGWAYENGGYGTRASWVQGEGIVVQTGNALPGSTSAHTGSGHGAPSGFENPRCRVLVYRLY